MFGIYENPALFSQENEIVLVCCTGHNRNTVEKSGTISQREWGGNLFSWTVADLKATILANVS